MKSINKVMPIVYFFLFLIGVEVITSYLAIDDAAIPSRYILHNFYNRNENIDTLFLGTSHTMYGIDPEVYERITGNKAYNCGTNWQYLDGSLALIKEADRLYDLKQVYVDLYFYVCRQPNRKERTSSDLVSAYYISDYMKPSSNKYMYIFSASNSEHYVEALIPQRRYIKNLADFRYIRSNLSKKSTENYQNYILESEYEKILKNGQTTCITSLENQGFYYEGIGYSLYDSKEEWNDWKKVLNEMINYCKEHDISITFMALPMSDFYIMQAGGLKYDEFIEEVLNVIETSGIEIDYWDFNLTKTRYLDLQEKDFKDISHLNSEGAKQVTALFADLEVKNNKEDIFHNNYQQKLDSEVKIFGINLMVDEEKNVITIMPATNADDKEITYKITHLDSEIKINYQKNASFQYETGEKYKICSYINDKLCNTVWYTGK